MPRISTLTASELAGLACPYCGRQLPGGTAWLGAAEDAWGGCGVKLFQDDEVTGLLAIAPGEPGKSAMVKMVWVRPEVAGHGLGRQLVQAAAAELLRHKVRVLLSPGARVELNCATPPQDFLSAVGFTRPDAAGLWRLDLRQAALDRTGLGIFGRLFRGLVPARPTPAGGTVSGRVNRG